jgi:hypothetical protein
MAFIGHLMDLVDGFRNCKVYQYFRTYARRLGHLDGPNGDASEAQAPATGVLFLKRGAQTGVEAAAKQLTSEAEVLGHQAVFFGAGVAAGATCTGSCRRHLDPSFFVNATVRTQAKSFLITSSFL